MKFHLPLTCSIIFICQIMTQADLGLADAYINEDFSFVDKDEGLLNLIMVNIIHRIPWKVFFFFF